MNSNELNPKRDRNGVFISCLLVISCLYKIAVVKDGVLQRILSPIVGFLPLTDISKYTNTISLVKMLLVGLCLHTICILYWLYRERWKIRVTRSINEECLLLIFLVRMISECWVHRGLSAYSLVYDLLCVFFVLVFYQIGPNEEDMCSFQERISKCIYRIGFVCAVFAVAYYVVGLNQSFSVFEFRLYRIGGFAFDAILAGFLYGIGLISAFDLHKAEKIKTIELVVAAIFFAVGMLLTGSRSALYFLTFAIFYFIGSKKRFSKYLYIGLFGVLAIIVYSSFVAEQDLSFVSDGARSYKYALAFDVFVSHPVAGVGTNMFQFYDEVYGSNPHNLPLTLLAENGIIGFLPWIIWFIVSMINVVKTKSQYWRWLMISFIMLSMILGTLTNTITVILMILVTWTCEVSSKTEEYEQV